MTLLAYIYFHNPAIQIVSQKQAYVSSRKRLPLLDVFYTTESFYTGIKQFRQSVFKYFAWEHSPDLFFHKGRIKCCHYDSQICKLDQCDFRLKA